ncbi:hypothetical protein CYMTET_43734, partial [Cymbomonas tetramitiformis]
MNNTGMSDTDALEPYERSKSFILDAFQEVSRTQHVRATRRAWKAHEIGKFSRNYVTKYAMLLWVCYTFFEQPNWCSKGGQDTCHAAHYPSWRLPNINKDEALSVELCFAACCVVEIIASAFAYGWKYFSFVHHRVLTILFCFAFFDIPYKYGNWETYFRVGPLLRISIYVAYSDELRKEFWYIGGMLPKMVGIAFIGLSMVAVFAWAGLLIFEGTPEGAEYFPTIFDSAWTLLVLMTTSNWPDAMLPAYSDKRSTAFFFIIFQLAGLFFFLNFILAMVYNEYLLQEKESLQLRSLEREANLDSAFQALGPDQNGKLKREKVMNLLGSFGHSESEQRLMFAALDKDGANQVGQEEFRNICTVIQLRFEKVQGSPLLKRFPWLSKTYAWLWVNEHLDLVDRIGDLVVLASGLFIFCTMESAENLWINIGDACFVFIFLLEIAIKGAVLGWG